MMMTWGWKLLLLILVSPVLWCLFDHIYYILKQYKQLKQQKQKEDEKSCKIPRGSSGWPVIGETLEFIASGYSSRPVAFMDKRKSQYGKVFRTHILGRPIIVSTDTEVNKAILQNHGNVFIPSYPKSVTELLGKSSILQTNGPLHKKLHSLIGGFLRSPQLKSRIAIEIEDSLKHSLSIWEHKEQPILLQYETKQISFEVLVRVLMSVGPGEDMEFLRREFQEFIKGLICIPVKFPGTRLYKSLQAKKKLFKMVRKIVEERKLGMEKTGQKFSGSPSDVIEVLLNDIEESLSSSSSQLQQLTLDSISDNIIEMLIAGEDTVPMVMTLAIKFLSDNPVALSRVVEENMNLKRLKTESCEGYAWTDYMSLQFTQNVISETLRMANIINAVWRKSVKDVEIKGYLIPKDWCVVASFTSVHMDEENYENPYQFNPWRWETRGIVNASNAFTPFSGGQRLCPGLELSRLEISIFLHHFVTKYRWEAEDDNIVTFPTVKMKRKLPITIMPMVQQHY